jgi:hypothetical protein
MKKFLSFLLLGMAFCVNAEVSDRVFIDFSKYPRNSWSDINLNYLPPNIPYKIRCTVYKRNYKKGDHISLELTLAPASYINKDSLDYNSYEIWDGRDYDTTFNIQDNKSKVFIMNWGHEGFTFYIRHLMKISDIGNSSGHFTIKNTSGDDIYLSCAAFKE